MNDSDTHPPVLVVSDQPTIIKFCASVGLFLRWALGQWFLVTTLTLLQNDIPVRIIDKEVGEDGWQFFSFVDRDMDSGSKVAQREELISKVVISVIPAEIAFDKRCVCVL